MSSALLSCRIFILLTCFLFVNGSKKRSDLRQFKMVIDQDGGADDAMAIYMAILYEKYFNGPSLIAITTVHGNVDEHQCYNNTMRILSIAERQDIPIHRGSENALVLDSPADNYFGFDGLGDNDYGMPYEPTEPLPLHASIALLELSKDYEGKLIVVALGSMTNIATAIKLDPLFLGRLAHLYIGAGNIGTTPEFNALSDVEAYYATVKSIRPDTVTVVPFSQVPNISREWRLNVFGKIQKTFVDAMNAFESVSFRNDEWLRLDPVVMAIALNKSLIKESKLSNNSIILCGEGRGINRNVYTKDLSKANVELIISVSKTPYKNFLVDVFS